MPDQGPNNGNDKKLANMHYPGMKANPDEGKAPVDDNALWRFEDQIACLGKETQLKLLRSSAVIVGANPLAAYLTKRLFGIGIGRVGVVGEEAVRGAHGVTGLRPPDPVSLLKSLSAWCKAEQPWAQFEPFSVESIDRQLDDIVRGFDFVLAPGREHARRALVIARELGLPAIIGDVKGRVAWALAIPAKSICEDCLELPSESAEAGMFYPLLELIANRVAVMAWELLEAPGELGVSLELIDRTKIPRHNEARKLAPKPGCRKCSQK